MQTTYTNTQARLFEVELQCLKTFCENNLTEVTLRVLNIIRREAWDELLALGINPAHYSPEQVERFRTDYQAVSMLSKSVNLPIKVDRRRKALEKFDEAEKQCADANERILSWGSNPKDAPWLVDVVAKAQLIIRTILGPLDEDALQYVEANCRFGPGSTRSVGRRPTHGRKFDNPRPMASPRLAEFYKRLIPALWADRLVKVEVKASSRITTVAKNARTDRTICIEPDLNIYVQLGVGALIRNRLQQSGLNLAKQADRNAYLASRAHLLGLATIDLSSASDCVSRSLVELLLPEEWRHLLRLARTDYYELDGVEHPFNKWSSMGNGYTFELETLIFLALARACGDMRAVSYGDDIIVAQGVTPLLLSTLNFLGFSVNEKKTYLHGHFYESCGTDWFNGENVRPFFLKGEIPKEVNDITSSSPEFLAVLYQYANAVSNVASRIGHGVYRDRRYFSVWRGLFQGAPKPNRLRIPAGFNTSGGFECDWDETATELDHHSASAFKYLRFAPLTGHIRGDWGPLLSWFNPREESIGFLNAPSLETYAKILAKSTLSTDSYHCNGESYRSEGSYHHEIGSCFAWPNRGPWI